jgi:thiamine-monophosphate kinase
MKTEASLIRKLSGIGSSLGPASRVILGIGDDAALLAPKPGYDTILTCDWFLEGTHFRREVHPPDAVGWKCLARAISDIAAMGGEPRCFLLSLAIPEPLTGRWLSDFLGGLRQAARKLRCPLAGGDTTRQQKVLINITVVGDIRVGRALLRSGAGAGDILYVSGRLGEAELGLQMAEAGRRSSGRGAATKRKSRADSHIPKLAHSFSAAKSSNLKTDPSVRKHFYPEPRLALGRWLADHRMATAMMDLSDGLSTDLKRLCEASGAGARLEAARIPAVRVPKWEHAESVDSLALALHGGDDYELLFSVRPSAVQKLPRAFHGVPLTPIGVMTRNAAIVLVQPDGDTAPLRPGGWDPFGR